MRTPSPRTWTRLGWLAATVLLVLGAWVRLADLDSNPPGFWQDEASTGLDAYQIWTTGRDRAGDLLPVISRSFGDYPLAGYRYLAAPIVGLFGTTVGNERLVAALIGTLMIIAIGFAVRRTVGNVAALAAVMSAAFCPTWIHFSRYGSEAILLPAALITGFALIEHGRDRRWKIWLGALVLATSAYTYHAVKLILPLWIIAYVIYQWPFIRSLWREDKRHVIGPMLLFALAVTPSVWAAFTVGGQARGRTVLAWYHFDGWRLARVVMNNYLTYFDFGMLFVRGGPAVAQSIPGVGLWNLIELPSILIGIHHMVSGGPRRRLFAFFLFWFVLGPLPGGVTYESHNIGRVIAWLPAPQIISGIGLWRIAGWATSAIGSARVRRFATVGAIGIAWMATGAHVMYLTLIRYPETTERDWQFEITRAIQCARDKRTDERIVVSPQFQAVHVFATYHLTGLPLHADGKPAWIFGTRSEVKQGELYVMPASEKLPIGVPICTVRLKIGSSAPRAYVFAAQSGAPAPPKPDESAGPKAAALAPGVRSLAPSLQVNAAAIVTSSAAPPRPRLEGGAKHNLQHDLR